MYPSPESSTGTLRVFAFRLDDFEGNDSVRFDNVLITGTAIAIPEPSSLALFGLAGLAIVRRRRS